jgi:hypothetical protein
LHRRRAELVTMPHAVRRVVVARGARIAASMAFALGGVALVALAAFPSAAARVASVLPGSAPAPLATVLTATWVIGVVAWAMSGARSQHRFAVAMSRYVLPSEDLDHDVERLDHERPDDMARTMGHRLEVGSAAWPVVAAGAIVPVTMLWLSMLVAARGYVTVTQLEEAIPRHVTALGMFALAGGLGAIVMTRRTARHPLVATLLVPLGILACGAAGVGLATTIEGAWICGAVAAIVMVVGVVVRRLRRERALIDIADPAAGSELFTIRGAIRELRAGLARIGAGLAAVRAGIGRSSRKTRIVVAAVATATLAGGAGYSMFAHRAGHAVAQPIAVAQAIAVPTVQDPLPLAEPPPIARPNLHVEARAGSFWYDVTLDPHGYAALPIPGFDVLPQGWQADFEIEFLGPQHQGVARVEAGGASLAFSSIPAASTVHVDACRKVQPMVIGVFVPTMGEKEIKLRILPRMRVGDCRPLEQ